MAEVWESLAAGFLAAALLAQGAAAEPANPALARHDADGDGAVSVEEWQAALRGGLYRRWDANGDGTLGRDEAYEGLKAEIATPDWPESVVAALAWQTVRRSMRTRIPSSRRRRRGAPAPISPARARVRRTLRPPARRGGTTIPGSARSAPS